VLERTVSMLNELGEHAGAAQLAHSALRHAPSSLALRWELALAAERLWKLNSALHWLRELPPEYQPPTVLEGCTSPGELEGMCHIKRLDDAHALTIAFRTARDGKLPERFTSGRCG